MGSKEGGAAMSPAAPPSPRSAVCCMCGDCGLPRELFRCKVCLTRSQHKYCSNLYPKAETYRACNWCLRDEGGKPASDHHHQATTVDDNNLTISTINKGTGSTMKRGTLPLHLNEPVKKQQRVLLQRSASEVIVRMQRSEDQLSPVVSGKGRPGLRGKVRRYKLLEEVSS